MRAAGLPVDAKLWIPTAGTASATRAGRAGRAARTTVDDLGNGGTR
jgi:hypothetical protein